MTNKSKQKKRTTVKSSGNQKSNANLANQITNQVMSKLSMKDTTLGQFGRFAGNGISKIFGLGAYKMTRNSLYDSATGSQVPFMHSTNESIIFRHREYICDVSSSTNFVNHSFPVNPGVDTTFPFLATLASSFQEYRFRGLIFEFKSTGATALVSGTNTAMGTISMVAQYRADAPAPETKLEVLNQMWSADGKTSDSFILPIECAPKENAMNVQYIRTKAGYTGDIKMYDLCTLQVSAVGSQGSNTVGELWCSYDVEFMKPKMTESGGVIGTSHITRVNTGVGAAAFGALPSTEWINDLGVTVNAIIPSASSYVEFPQNTVGSFLIIITHVGTAAAVTAPVPTYLNCSPYNGWLNNTVPYTVAPQNGLSASVVTYSITVKIQSGSSGVKARVTIPAGSFPSTSTIDVVVSELYDSYQ